MKHADQTGVEALHVHDVGRHRHVCRKHDAAIDRAAAQTDEHGANARLEQKDDLNIRVEEAHNKVNGEVHLSAGLAKRPVEPRDSNRIWW